MELGPFGLSELVFIAVLALVVFGPRRLPEIGHAAGRLVAKLRRATNELRATWESELDAESRESMREAARQLHQVKQDLSAAGRQVWEGGATAAASVQGAAESVRGAAQDARRAILPTDPLPAPAEPAPPTPETPAPAPARGAADER